MKYIKENFPNLQWFNGVTSFSLYDYDKSWFPVILEEGDIKSIKISIGHIIVETNTIIPELDELCYVLYYNNSMRLVSVKKINDCSFLIVNSHKNS